MKIYNKLVRDNIPQIIQAQGDYCEFEIVSDKNKLIQLLETKVMEEWQEYIDSKDISEIADTIEVLFSLAERKGTTRNQLLELMNEKTKQRGGFNKGILLIRAIKDN